MNRRVAQGAALLTPVVALLVCAPWHLTRFSPPKVAVAFFGVLLGLLRDHHTKTPLAHEDFETIRHWNRRALGPHI